MYKVITFTTQELFEKVWATPVLKSAQEIGVSDVGLSKACRKAVIPLPSRGYLAKQPSKRPGRPRRPADKAPISFKVLDRGALPARVEAEIQPAVPPLILVVPDSLITSHPLVARWLKRVQSAKTNQGCLVTAGKHVLRAQIWAAQIDRSALIFDRLIKAGDACRSCNQIGVSHGARHQRAGER